MQLRLNKWSDLNIGVEPDTSVVDVKQSSTATLLGSDYQGTKFQILADEGTKVSAGQALMWDRRHPQIVFVSPVSGVVSSVLRGKRRRLIALKIDADDAQNPVNFKQQNIRSLMLQSGLWSALRSRPFGHVPEPDAEPKALLITAIDTQPLAPDPAVVIAQYEEDFAMGLKSLGDLVNAPVYLCKSSSTGFEFDQSRIAVAEYDGPHPAGLVGRHIHALSPIGFDGGQVWHIGYQDVISLGHLVKHGEPWQQRIISLAGSAVKNPRLIRVPLGASIADITAGELIESQAQIFSGSILSGKLANEAADCLGRFHLQVTAVAEAEFGINPEYAARPLIAIPDLDKATPPGILAIPLLRALLVGDVERALELGALELVEEDLAMLSYHCPTQTDYGVLLRNMLNQIEREGLSIRGR